MIKDNLILNNFDINYFMQWGTPEDLNEFNWYSKLFKNKITKTLKKEEKIEGTLIMPCAGLGKRFLIKVINCLSLLLKFQINQCLYKQ